MLAKPPRPVPLSLRIQLLFGGFLNQFGWLFLGFGLIFFWAFTMQSDFSVFRFWFGSVRTTMGQVLNVEATKASENKRRIYEIRFEYRTPEGVRYEDSSYTSGHTPSIGSEVVVEYLASDPSVGRIEGCRRRMFPMWTLFVVIFPGAGLTCVFFGLRQGIRANYLLAYGKMAWGKLTNREPTNTRVNKQTVWKFVFSFEADDGRTYTIETWTHETERLEDGSVAVLYHPRAPTFNVMMDNLPGDPQVDPNGNLRARNPFAAVLVLIVPTLTVLGHGLWRLMAS